MNSRGIVVTISDFGHPKPSRPGWGNAIKHRVDGVRHIGAAIWCEGGVVQEGLACAKTVIQFRNETTVFSVVDKDQAGLPPYYHEAVKKRVQDGSGYGWSVSCALLSAVK